MRGHLLAALVAALILAAGCAGYGGDGDATPTDTPTDLAYPGAEELEPPKSLVQDLESEWSGNVSVSAYATDDSAQEVRDWYAAELEAAGWSEAGEVAGATVWIEGRDAVGVKVLSAEASADRFEVDRRVILVVRGSL